MTCDKQIPGIYLIVEFNWPESQDTDPEHVHAVMELHEAVEDSTWINEVFAASGGSDGEFSAMWVFWVADHSSLDRLLREKNDRASKAYDNLFSKMLKVRTKIREEVIFS